MIRKESREWESFLARLDAIKNKSNRDVLCLDCWAIFNYEQKIKHLRYHEDHATQILTSKDFACEAHVISLATEHKKVLRHNEELYVEDPFQNGLIISKQTKAGTPRFFLTRFSTAEKSAQSQR